MAISTKSYFSNSLVGVPQVAGETVDIYDSSANPKFALGTKFERQDGAIFRYAHFAGVTSAGWIMASVASDVTLSMVTSAAVAPSATYQMPNETPGVYPGSVGSRYFVSGGSAAGAAITPSVNQYAGGYMTIISSGVGGGIGYNYRIKGNTAVNTPATGLTRFELYDPLAVALTTNITMALIGNKYNNLGPVNNTTYLGAAVPAGIVPIVQAAGYYGWVQTRGLVGVIMDANVATMGSAGMLVSINTASGVGIGSVYSTLVTAAANNTTLAPIIGTLAAATCGSYCGVVDVKLD